MEIAKRQLESLSVALVDGQHFVGEISIDPAPSLASLNAFTALHRRAQSRGWMGLGLTIVWALMEQLGDRDFSA